MSMLPVTYGYARVSKSDDDARNLETQLRLLVGHGVRPNLIYRDVATGRSLARSGWQELMDVVQPGDTITVAFLDRFSRNFEEGVRIQADLIERDIGIVAIRENIDVPPVPVSAGLSPWGSPVAPLSLGSDSPLKKSLIWLSRVIPHPPLVRTLPR